MKEDLIRKKMREYIKSCGDLDKNSKTIVTSICSQLAFLDVTLSELKNTVNEDGATVERINGNGFTVIEEHPAQRSYNATIKSYNATLKALAGYISVGEKEDNSNFANFLGGSRGV